jgi:nitrogen regulatory protein PII
LVETRKELFLAIIPENLKYKVLEKINNVFHLEKEGTGIGFILPISSSNKFLSESFNKIEIVGDDDMSKNKKYHLIITIVYEGYLEKVMTAAKKAGCNGGTVMKGRSLSDVIPTKILGFNIEQERDVILNIVEEKDKNKVMEAITKEAGIKTSGKGICFAIPIEATMGLDNK